MRLFRKSALSLICASALLAADMAQACTRAVYQGPNDRVLTGRSICL